MITVGGEVLIDLVADEVGTLTPLPGGASFNVARIVARLGGDCTFLGRLSDDRFGDMLRAELVAAGVQLAVPAPTNAPTTIALAQLDPHGSADYRFYFEATAAAALRCEDVPEGLLSRSRALAVGGLGIVFEPIRSTLLELVARAPDPLLVVLDPNCRPRAIADPGAYRETVASLMPRVDVLKASVEDVALLAPGSDPVEYGIRALARGPVVVLITDGPGAVTLVTADGIRSVPVPPVEVVDTIGAGDAFVAGLLSWLAGHPDVDPRAAPPEVLQAAVEAAIEVSVSVCSTRGATLPERFSWRGRESASVP